MEQAEKLYFPGTLQRDVTIWLYSGWNAIDFFVGQYFQEDSWKEWVDFSRGPSISLSLLFLATWNMNIGLGVLWLSYNLKSAWRMWGFPGDPVVRTPCFHCRVPGFDPWLGNFVGVVWSLIHIWLSATPWTAAGWLLCPPPSPRVFSNSCPLSQWCYPTISSSAVSFSEFNIA